MLKKLSIAVAMVMDLQDNARPCVLEKAGLKKEVLTFFNPFFSSSEDLVFFKYSNGGKILAVEYFGVQGIRIPSTTGLWEAGAENPVQVRNLFLFSSAIEAFSFFHYFPDGLCYPEQIAVASLGLLPSSSQIASLKSKYKYARFHLVFGPDLLGRVIDCRVSLWVKEKDARFLFNRQTEVISMIFRGKAYALIASSLSLFAFERLLKLRSGIRTHKPPKNSNSFYELFQSSI